MSSESQLGEADRTQRAQLRLPVPRKPRGPCAMMDRGTRATSRGRAAGSTCSERRELYCEHSLGRGRSYAQVCTRSLPRDYRLLRPAPNRFTTRDERTSARDDSRARYIATVQLGEHGPVRDRPFARTGSTSGSQAASQHALGNVCTARRCTNAEAALNAPGPAVSRISGRLHWHERLPRLPPDGTPMFHCSGNTY